MDELTDRLNEVGELIDCWRHDLAACREAAVQSDPEAQEFMMKDDMDRMTADERKRTYDEQDKLVLAIDRLVGAVRTRCAAMAESEGSLRLAAAIRALEITSVAP